MSWDIYLFHAVNGLSNRWGSLDAFGVFAAMFLLPLLGVLLVLSAFTVKRLWEEHWYELPLKAFIAGALAYTVRQIIGVILHRPRPFINLSDMHLLVPAETSYSFPSGHVSIAFALAFVIYRHDRDWGIAFLVLALLVGFGRIFVGVHYPLDVLGGIVVGWAAAWAVAWFEKREWGKIARKMSN